MVAIMIDTSKTPALETFRPKLHRFFELSGRKIHAIEQHWGDRPGTPVFTVDGIYTSRGWTEWTQGFRFGSMLLHYEATGDIDALDAGVAATVRRMAVHVTHTGVHDHGFNTISTWGALWRLITAGAAPERCERYLSATELAIKTSGAVQASRWRDAAEGLGYIFSFNGPHSLFADTIRSLRVLALAHRLGHILMGEQDRRISLLDRLLTHAETTARYAVYFGEGRDIYDIRGRVAHESLFNPRNGAYRCPATQQGYSPFTTWTRALAWILLGFAELAEFLEALDDGLFDAARPCPERDRAGWIERCVDVASAVADYYIDSSPSDGIPYWDTGAPGLALIENYDATPAKPFNRHEPVDSSAASICAQGLIRLSGLVQRRRDETRARGYMNAALTTAARLLEEPYLSADDSHQGLVLHSVYHRPNGWDHIPAGQAVPCGESSMWGDYHAREVALMLLRMVDKKRFCTFFG
jgi:hypothetical protein